MKPIVSFRTARAMTFDYVCFSGAMDMLDAYAKYTRVITYDEDDEHVWIFHEVDDIVTSISLFKSPADGLRSFVTLTQEGGVSFMDETELEEKIPGAGVFSEEAKGWGYMSSLKQIGDHLYACGGAGQVYKRQEPNQWQHMDQGILQAPDVKERLLPDVIDGPHENAIYLAGAVSAEGLPPFVYFWNGQAWHSVKLPDVAERITAMHVQSAQRIWLCGANGTLLVGNAREGFQSLSTIDDNQLFTSITEFEGRMYLASNYGLFVYDPQKHWQGIQRVKTTLKPDLQDANIVDAVDGVLWSIGPKDIARFDGQAWVRIHDPDNPRIEEPKSDGWEG
jgi:hypothetical protein